VVALSLSQLTPNTLSPNVWRDYKEEENKEGDKEGFFHRPNGLEPDVAPKIRERFVVAVVDSPPEATTESEALPLPDPVGRSVIALPVCATEPFKNHCTKGFPAVVGIENGAA
jgi:hypothetical protein